jgi:S1-C subfamily serine protease
MKKIFFIFLLFCIAVYAFSQSKISTGTGFLISNDGLIVTCAHVIEGSQKITVNIDKKEYIAEVVAKNTNTDLAIIKINFQSSSYFKIANFESTNLGDKVFVLGYPLSAILGSDIRVTDGIVSAKSGAKSDPTYFQISAPIQHGNSGGPIVNEKFEVIGVAAAKLNDFFALESSGAIPQNVNFGVKGSYIGPLLDNFKNNSTNIKSINDAIKATVQIISQSTPAQDSPSVQIVNHTGYTVYYVYIRPVTDNICQFRRT